MAYPDTSLLNDVLDPEYGGEPASAFGTPAWTWLNGVVRQLSRWALDHVRVPHDTIVVVSDTAAIAGDVAFAFAEGTSSGGYKIGTSSATGTKILVIGIYLEPVSVGGRARVAIGGAIPPTITGLGVQSSPQNAGYAGTPSRTRVWQTGDTVIGKIDVKGNLWFTGYGAFI